MVIYLVRHGETDWNREGRLQGQKDIELNDTGRKQAAKIREKLAEISPDAAFSSSLKRARETLEIILKGQNIPVWADSRLMEVDFGRWDGSLVQEAKEDESHPLYDFYKHPDIYLPPQTAESYEHLNKRVWEFMNEQLLPLERQYKSILVVAHGGVNRSILNPLMNIPLEHFWDREMGNCAIAKIGLEDGRFCLLEYDPGTD